MAKGSTFTSYINAELPSNVDANFRRLEQVATRTYGNITRQAENASRAAAGLIGGRGTGGAGGAAASAALSRQAASVPSTLGLRAGSRETARAKRSESLVPPVPSPSDGTVEQGPKVADFCAKSCSTGVEHGTLFVEQELAACSTCSANVSSLVPPGTACDERRESVWRARAFSVMRLPPP